MKEEFRALWRLYILMMTPNGVFDTSFRAPVSIRGELSSLVQQSMAAHELPKVVHDGGSAVHVLGWDVSLETEQYIDPTDDDALKMKTTLVYAPIIGMLAGGEYMIGTAGVIRDLLAWRLAMPCVTNEELAVMEQLARAYVSGDERTPSARRVHRRLKPVIRFVNEVGEFRAALLHLLSGDHKSAN